MPKSYDLEMYHYKADTFPVSFTVDRIHFQNMQKIRKSCEKEFIFYTVVSNTVLLGSGI